MIHSKKDTAPARRKAFTAVTVAALVASVFLTSACESESVETVGGSTSKASAPAVAKEGQDPVIEAGAVINGIPTKKELAKSSRGIYIQSTISDDDPAFEFRPEIVDGSAATFDAAELESVQKKFVKFVAEEAMDSTLSDRPSDQDIQEWVDRNQDKMDPGYRDVLSEILISRDTSRSILFLSGNRAGDYPLNYGETATHVTARKITPIQVWSGVVDGRDILQFKARVSFELAVNVDGKPGTERVTGEASYAYAKDATDGQWRLSGFQNGFNATLI